MNRPAADTRFVHHLRKVLGALYDPKVLRASPLTELLDLTQESAPDAALRRLIREAIESLRPGANTPTGSRTWRLYHVLRRRYIEQLTQQEVASDLSLSVRQLQREEKVAREVLADYLWHHYDLEGRMAAAEAKAEAEMAQDVPAEETTDEPPTRAQELARLKESVPSKEAQVHDLVREVLTTLEPLKASLEVAIAYEPDMDLPPIHLKTPLLRQAMLNVISATLRCAQGGTVTIATHVRANQVCIEVATAAGDADCPLLGEELEDSLTMAEELMALCRGTMAITTSCVEEVSGQGVHLVKRVTVTLALPAARRTGVLVIDDNADVLHLFQRYMAGTHYRFIGTRNPQEGLDLAGRVHPDIIVLDVMMPGRDGWAMLSQLRENPETQAIPVIVCTILSQRDLAMILGAADFVRKPVNRAEFLDVLDRQRDSLPTTSD
jgi:CheY-like chemotaxis protein